MKKRKKLGRKLLSFLLTLAMVFSTMTGIVPGMSLTALADGTTYNPASAYTDYAALNTNNTVVTIDEVANVEWYVIGYDSEAKTVTLLSKTSFGKKAFNSNRDNGNNYANSEIKTFVEGLTGDGQPLAGIKDALADIRVTGDPSISGAVPYLLSTTEANNALDDTKKGSDTSWWLRSPVSNDARFAACVYYGVVYDSGRAVSNKYAVRPALQLNLESVIFDSESKTFTVGSATVDVTGVSLDKTTAQTIDVDGKVSFTATVAPDNATDKKVKWSVGGTNAGAVKLYTDADCATEVGTDATETLTVYAKGVSAGSATVTATSNADSTKSASCDVTVNAAQTQTETLLTTITATGKEQASYSTANVATVSFSYTAGGSSAYLANWGWWGYGWTATVNAAEGYTITKCVFYDDANRTATDSSSPFVVETTEEDKTPRINGTPIDGGNFQSKGLKKIEVYGYATPAATHSVTITAGDHMTKTAGSGDAEQTGLTGAMTDVVYTANDGYYFPTDYSVTSVNGISVTRNTYTQITVSGTPTADAAITLTAPTAKTKPDAPTTAAAVDCTTADNNDGKLTGVTTAMEYKNSDATDWIAGTGSDITGLVPGTYYVRLKATDTTTASDNQELTVKEFISYTVTFKVVNGKWNEGEGDAAAADKTVTLAGHDGDTLKLTADQIPAVGSKPNDTYKAGSWDTTPSMDTEITADTTYTYTYAQKDTISQTVTFKVVNGSWNDETTADKTVTLTGYEGDTLKLTADQIPAVGTKPNGTYKAGSWDVTPSTETEITAATTYTYTYAQKDTISQTVTFKVVNGSWNDETTADKTVTLTGYEGDTLKLTADQIPAVGDKPNDTYKAGSWDVTPSADTEITGATTYTYTYAQKDTISQTVTFKVVNGSWNDETTTDKTVTLTGYEGDTLKLAADQIPAVGDKPNDTHKAGSWDVTPSADTEITGATTYTYTYAQKDTISQTVTFKVVNGSWNDETTADKTVTLTGYEGDTLKLAADQIPAVGTKPNDTYKAGSWDVTPNTDTAITEATTYTYTYVAKEASVVTKAPEAKTLTYTGSAQELVTAGEATGGEMQYALGTATEAAGPYTTSIPTGTDAGTYYVWYKVAGDDNHLDTNPLCVKVKIMNTGMFADIEYGTWKYTAAEAVYEKQIMVGKGMVDGKIIFAPDDKVNRSQLVTSIYAMDGKPDVDYVQRFSDVKESDWFAKAVTWASNNEITAGTSDGQFGATGNATREQVAVMLYKYAQYCGYDVTISESTALDGFADADKVHSWALDAVKWAVERKIISGKGKSPDLRIAPDQSATRIECAAMLNRFSEVCTLAMIPDEILEEPIALPMEDIEESPASIEEPEEDIEDESEDIIDDKEEEIIDDEEEEVIDNEEEEVIDNEEEEVIDNEEEEIIDDEEEEVIDDEEEEIIDDEKEEVIDNRETEGI